MFLWPLINFTKNGEAHSVDIVTGESRGGCGGAWTLRGAGRKSLYIEEGEDQRAQV